MGKGAATDVTIGYYYYLSMQLALCHGPVDSIKAIKGGETATIWSGGPWTADASGAKPGGAITEDGYTDVYNLNLFGGKFKEGGIAGRIRFAFGKESQGPNEWLRAKLAGTSALPAFRGITCVLWEDICYGANTATPKPWRVLTTRIPLKTWTGTFTDSYGTTVLNAGHATVNGQDANPAHTLLEALIDTTWGLGYDWNDIDQPSFARAAVIFAGEGFGISTMWENASTAEDFISLILQHCNAALYVHPTTGKFTLKAIRGNYNPDSLFIVDDSNIIDMEEMTRVGVSELVNQVTVKWVDQPTSEWRSVTVHNPAVREMQGSVVAVTREYSALTNAVMAKKVGMRDLSVMSQPLASVKLTLNRTASSLTIGDVIKWNWPELGIDGMILRVVGVGYGLLDGGAITLDCVEDVFGAHLVNYTTPTGTEWEDPRPLPYASPAQIIMDASYIEVKTYMDSLYRSMSELDKQSGSVLFLAASPSSPVSQYELWSAIDGASYEYRKTIGFNAYGTVQSIVPPAVTSSFTVENIFHPDAIRVDDYAICGDANLYEMMQVLTVSYNTQDRTAYVSCVRGIADTTPGFLFQGSGVWFYNSSQGVDRNTYVFGTTVEAKARTRTDLGLLDLNGAPESEQVVGPRWLRPYPPGNLKINGARYPLVVTGDAVITWSHRDRVSQQTFVVRQNATNQGPETGTSYTLRIFSRNGTIITTRPGISDNTYTYTRAEALQDWAGAISGGVSPQDAGNTDFFYIGVVAVRDGLASHRAAFSAVSKYGEDNYQFPLFGAYDPLVTPIATEIMVTNLVVKSNGNGFAGRDAEFSWSDNHEQLFGPGTKFSEEEQATWFKDYKVVISKNGVTRSTHYVTEPQFTYTYAMNQADGLSRTFSISVAVRNQHNEVSTDTGFETGNTPALVSDLEFKPKSGTGSLVIYPITDDPAVVATKVYASQTNNFTPNASNLVYHGTDVIINTNTGAKGVWYIRVKLIDDFGEFGAVMSDQFTPDITPPSPPTNLTAQPMIRSIVLRWTNPPEPDLDYVEVWMSITNDRTAGAKIAEARNGQNFLTVLNLPPQAVPHFFWVRAVDTSGNFSLFNTQDNNGVSSSTLAEVEYMIALLQNAIGNSMLAEDLAERLDGIDGPATLAGTYRQLIYQEAINRGTAIAEERLEWQNGDINLAQSIGLITASSSTGFDSGIAWYFDSNVEGWTSDTVTVQTWSQGQAILDCGDANQQFMSPADLRIVGDQPLLGTRYTVIKLRIKRLAGNGWKGQAYCKTVAGGSNWLLVQTVAAPDPFDIGDTRIVDFDMYGVAAWMGDTITQIRLDLGASAADKFAVDWVSVGRNGPAASTAGLYNEQLARTDGDKALAQSINALSASSVGFDTAKTWYFDASVEGWTSAEQGMSWANGVVTLVPTGPDSVFTSPDNLGISGAKYSLIKVRITRLAGTGWVGRVQYTTAGHGFSMSHRLAIPAPKDFAIGQTAIVAFDMTHLTAGEDDWVTSTIKRIRFFFGNQTTGDQFDVDWVGVGRDGPAVSTATFLEEQTVRTSLHNSYVEDITALTSTIDGDGTPANPGLSATVAVQAQSLNGVYGKYTVKIDNNGYVSGYGLMSSGNVGTIGGGNVVSSFGVRADSFFIADQRKPNAEDAKTPFIVITQALEIDGTRFEPGVYMDNAMIRQLDAHQINTRGLTIRDDKGNVIFGAGVGLDWNAVFTRSDNTTTPLLTNKPGSLSAINQQEGMLISSLASDFSESFDGATVLQNWQKYGGQGEVTVVSNDNGLFGGRVMVVGNNSGNDMAHLIHKRIIPFDVTRKYRIRCRIRRVTGSGKFSIGVAGVLADGETLVNAGGSTDTHLAQHYCVVSHGNATALFTEFTGYLTGLGSVTGSGGVGTIASPAALHPMAKYIRPLIAVNESSASGQYEIDAFIIESLSLSEVSWSEVKDAPTNLAELNSADDGRLTAAQDTATAAQAAADAAAETAIWKFITGAGKPADYATWGSTIGQNLSGQFTQNNISAFFENAAIHRALIGYLYVDTADIKDLAVSTLKIQGNAVAFMASTGYYGYLSGYAPYQGWSSGWTNLGSLWIDMGQGSANSTLKIELRQTASGASNGVTGTVRIIDDYGNVIGTDAIIHQQGGRSYYIQGQARAMLTVFGSYGFAMSGDLIVIGFKQSQ
jgi:hypothetical protein